MGMMPAGGSKVFCGGLGPSNFAHGVVEGEAEHLDKEVDGVAGQIELWPAPEDPIRAAESPAAALHPCQTSCRAA